MMNPNYKCHKLESPCGSDPWGWCQECPNRAAAPAVLPADEREQFEAWAKQNQTPYDLRESKYIGNGVRTYYQDRTQWAFESFCGALRMLPAAAPVAESQPGALTQAQIDQIAEGWDGCMYDAPGEFIDIGASLRRALAALATPVPAAQETDAQAWQKNPGQCPVDPRVLVQVEVLDGPTMRREAGRLDWSIEDVPGDIVRWRLAPAMEAQSHE